MNRMMHPILVAALVTIFAHHINNPTEKAPTPVEIQTCLELIIDLGIMIEARGDHTDLTKYRDFCASLFAKLETGPRVQWTSGAAAVQGEEMPFDVPG
jgi:hypothetical protein